MSHAARSLAPAAGQSLHEQLRRQLLRQLKDAGLREAMLSEYKEMASTVSTLLHTLASEGLPDSLSPAAKAKYGECMARLTRSGIRCQMLAQESIDTDTVLHLAVADTSGERMQ